VSPQRPAEGSRPPDGSHTQAVLVLAWGNPDRRDDGAGWAVAAGLREALDPAEAEVLTFHQLAPEHAELLGGRSLVLFIDARVGDVGDSPLLERVVPAAEARIDVTHHMSAAGLLALGRDLYGASPPAWLLSIPARDLSFGEGLSPGAAALVGEAVRRAVAIIRQGA